MKTKIMLFRTICSVMATNVVFGQGTILLQHTGATDPTSEGFTFSSYPEIIGPVVNDQGFNAWTIHTTNGYSTGYSYALTSQQQSEISSADWSLSTTIRLIQSGNIGIEFVAGSEGGFFLNFGINSNGDPTVQAGSSSPVLVLSNVGSTYNNYQLNFDAAANTASLWVNGVEEANGINGDPNFVGSYWGLFWGEFQGAPCQANWNLVSLETIPEPSPAWLFVLGSGILFYVRCIRKRRRLA